MTVLLAAFFASAAMLAIWAIARSWIETSEHLEVLWRSGLNARPVLVPVRLRQRRHIHRHAGHGS